MKRKAIPLLASCFALFALAAGAADWRGFRGPGGSGVSDEKGLPTKWSDKENVVWRAPLPGPGTSSPVIAGDRVFVTCYSGYGVPGDDEGEQKALKRHLLCLDRKKGTVLWQKDVAAKLPEPRYASHLALHGYASSTPAVDAERVYVFFGKSGVYAFDLKGKQLWQKDVGAKTHGWGSATSPVLYKDLVIVNASVEGRSLVALRKKDGEEEWKASGVGGTWNTPVLVDVNGGKQELVVRGTSSLVGFDPSTGKKLWNFDGFRDGYVCPTVVAKDGIVYSLGGRFEGTNVAVKAGGTGDVTETNEVWTTKVGGG